MSPIAICPGFPFSKVGRKTCVGPHKYSLPRTPASTADVDGPRPCVDWPQRLATFAHPPLAPLRLPPAPLSPKALTRESSRSVECLQEPRAPPVEEECRGDGKGVRRPNGWTHSGAGMFRSRSTSALVIEAAFEGVHEDAEEEERIGAVGTTEGSSGFPQGGVPIR